MEAQIKEDQVKNHSNFSKVENKLNIRTRNAA